jgi:hypothetical protein
MTEDRTRAARARRRYSPAVLRRYRHWLILVPAAGVTLAVAAGIGYLEVERASKGPVFELAAECIRTNEVARVHLGVVTGFGIAVNGGVIENSDGTGRARIEFGVHGSNASGRAYVAAQLADWHWHLTAGTLSVGGRRYRLNLDDPIVPVRGPNLRNRCALPSSNTPFPKR